MPRVDYRCANGSQAPPLLDDLEVRPVLARAEGVGRARNRLPAREGAGAPAKRADLQRLSGQKLYPVIEFENGSTFVRSRRRWPRRSAPENSTASEAPSASSRAYAKKTRLAAFTDSTADRPKMDMRPAVQIRAPRLVDDSSAERNADRAATATRV